MGRKKSMIYLFAGIIAVSFLTWALIYAFGNFFTRTIPFDESIVPDFSPTISAKTLAPFSGLELVRLELDGEDITSSTSVDSAGFAYSPSQRLSEGEHFIDAEFLYRCLFSKEINLKWSFIIDTIAPEVSFENFDGVIATPVSRISLKGETEPDIEMKVLLNGNKIPFSGVDSKGNFVLDIWRLPEKENELILETVDKAGNNWSKKIPVLFDASPPEILSVFPDEGSVVRVDMPAIEINFEENTGIASANIWVDGGKIKSEVGFKNIVLKGESIYLVNGEHRAKVEIIDVAGNKVVKEWSFESDSTRLVLDISERRLYLYEGGLVLKTYRVAVGTPRYPTPLGSYRITFKRMNPTWYNPNKAWSEDMPPFIPPGPGNPLGPRALNLSASGIRIHGTPSTWSIGRAASHGCIRMYPRDVIDLFPRVSVGTPVDIIR